MAVAFKPGQKFKFPFPYDHIVTYFEGIRYENGWPIIGYQDANGQYAEMGGYELTDLIHA